MVVCVNSVFTDEPDWNKLLMYINIIISYLNYRRNVNDQLLHGENKNGISLHQFQHLKLYVPKSWPLRLGVIENYTNKTEKNNGDSSRVSN